MTRNETSGAESDDTSKNRSVVVHLRVRPPSTSFSSSSSTTSFCESGGKRYGEGCVLVTNEGPRGSVLVKCRDSRMSTSSSLALGGGGGVGSQHASFQFTGNVLRKATNDEVFDAVAKEAVEAATDGFNATILAYGQTGSGKTYTMGSGDGSYENRGIIPRALTMVFEKLKVGQSGGKKDAVTTSKTQSEDNHRVAVDGKTEKKPEAKVSVSFVEIYNENLNDLLNTNENPNHSPTCVISDAGPDSGVFVRGLTTKEVSCEDEALALWFEGDAQRAIGSHAMNDRSSRSHAVFTLNIETKSFRKTETSSSSSATLHRSKIHLVDLAGSERLRKTKSAGTVMREATFINKSLSVLERVIISLGERNHSNRMGHVPYRSSKLTHLLRDALGGNCKTVMVAHVSSDYQHAEETLTTCQLAKRMMRVENNAKLNECVETPSEKLTRLEREIKKLRAELKLLKSNAAASKKNDKSENYELDHEKEEGGNATDTAQPSLVQEEEEEEGLEICCAPDAASEDDNTSISSLGSHETARLNDKNEEARAYDEFKQTNGREKVKELSNAKAALRACKHRVRALSERVNEIKREMDATEKEYERRRIERSQTETKNRASSSGCDSKRRSSESEDENEDPNVIVNRIVDEVVSATEEVALCQDSKTKISVEEYDKNEESEKENDIENEKREGDEEESLHLLLRPLKASYRLAFDQLLSARDNLNAAELVVGNLSAKLHDSFVSFWKNSLSLQKNREEFINETSPVSAAVPLSPSTTSSSLLVYKRLTEQWSTTV